MRIWKIVPCHTTSYWSIPIFLLVFLVEIVAPSGAALIKPDDEITEGTTVEPVLKEGEYLQETPFGLTKRGPAKPVDKAAGTRNVEVEENEGLVTFRRTLPFGKQVWQRKRSELSAFEKRLLEIHREAAPSGRTPVVAPGARKSSGDPFHDEKKTTNSVPRESFLP